jgi:hypothetical protein
VPLKLTITLGDNSFTADGEFAFDDAFAATLRAWLNAAQQTGDAGETIETLTARLKIANDTEAATVAANTPQGA